MSRTIDPTVQALLDTSLGQEIIVVLEIFWTDRSDVSIQTFPPPTTQAERFFYADRPIDGHPEVRSSILSLSNVDAAVQVSQGGQSKSVSVELDDSDGELKTIFDGRDIHKAPCRVWFYVAGTDFDTEKFPIFLGQINSPVEWSEGERKFSFQIINRIEDVEVGFSAEEGAFVELPEELIGQTWPLCFGTTFNVPALKAVPAISGVLANGVGIKDFTLATRIELADAITCPQTPIGFKCSGRFPNQRCTIAFEIDASCTQQRCVELERTKLELEEQSRYEYAQITIFGGARFPQGFPDHVNTGSPGGPISIQLGTRPEYITLNINGGLFRGYFDGTPSNPSNVFKIKSRQHPRYDPSTGTVLIDPVQVELDSRCPGDPNGGQDSDSNYTDIFTGPVWTGLRNSRISWEKYREAKSADFFWAGGGSTVTLESAREIVYIANIIPSTILSVKAKRFLNGNEFLLTVPSEFFEIRQTDFNGYQVMEIVFQRPLQAESQDTGGGWSNDIFVTQTATVGPNTVDIIRWFIETYTKFSIDGTSFNDVRDKIDVYRMDFPLLSRPNLLDILQSLARKARCALWQRDDTFFIKYLAEEPTTVATLQEDDILQDNSDKGTLKILLTSTNDLITKHTSEWKRDYAVPKPNKLILRHNISKYGTHDATEDYFPYAFLDIVRKSATFWLIRSANTWKRVTCNVSLQFAKLEPFDAVLVDLPDVASVPVIGVVERATLNSEGKEIKLEIWTPVRSGETEAYDFAFPAGISENALYPTVDDRDQLFAGSGKDPNFSVIAPPGHPLTPDRRGIFSGFGLGCNGDASSSFIDGCRQDHGDQKPSDKNDKKPEPNVADDETGKVSGGTSPVSKGAGYGGGSTERKLKDQEDKNGGDAGRGREVGEGGGTGSGPGSGDNNDPIDTPIDQEFMDSLPDADKAAEDAEYSCTVTISGFDTKSIGGVGAGPERREICTPIKGTEFTEKYTFDAKEAADTFCSERTGRSSCSGRGPCGICISFCSVICSGDASKAGDGSLIGFTPDPGGQPPSILEGT